jgi:hypothetical protein
MANKRLSSTGWLVGETIKGLPKAVVKVGKAVASGIKSGAKAVVKPMVDYDKKEMMRGAKTPQGKAVQESLKNEGLLKTLKKAKKGELK